MMKLTLLSLTGWRHMSVHEVRSYLVAKSSA